MSVVVFNTKQCMCMCFLSLRAMRDAAARAAFGATLHKVAQSSLRLHTAHWPQGGQRQLWLPHPRLPANPLGAVFGALFGSRRLSDAFPPRRPCVHIYEHVFYTGESCGFVSWFSWGVYDYVYGDVQSLPLSGGLWVSPLAGSPRTARLAFLLMDCIW